MLPVDSYISLKMRKACVYPKLSNFKILDLSPRAYRRRDNGGQYCRGPKMSVPMRTSVEPAAMARR